MRKAAHLLENVTVTITCCHRTACVSVDSLSAMMSDIHSQGVI